MMFAEFSINGHIDPLDFDELAEMHKLRFGHRRLVFVQSNLRRCFTYLLALIHISICLEAYRNRESKYEFK